jgi:hypothetical protein
VLAARALGRLGGAGASSDASQSLREAAQHDTYALVRQAALESLASFDEAGARDLAVRIAANDPEPRVQELARALVAGSPPTRGD